MSKRDHFSRVPRRFRRIAQEGMQPGEVSQTLQRRMGDDIAEMFNEAGKELYKSTVEALKTVLRDQFEDAIPRLDEALKNEGGARWQRQSAEFYRPWINEVVEAIVTQGMNEAAGTLEDIASSYASKHAVKEEEGEGKEELLEIPKEETEDVEEAEPEEVEPAEEEQPEEGAGEEAGQDLEELLAAEFPRKKEYRPKRRPLRREALNRPWEDYSSQMPLKDQDFAVDLAKEIAEKAIEQFPETYQKVRNATSGQKDLTAYAAVDGAGNWGLLVLYDLMDDTIRIEANVSDESYYPEEDSDLYDAEFDGNTPTTKVAAEIAKWFNNWWATPLQRGGVPEYLEEMERWESRANR